MRFRKRSDAAEHHMTFHHLLESFEEAKHCGLCALEERAMKRYFDSVLYESVTDPEVRAHLRRAHGYCSAHAHYLVGLRSAFDTAVLYQDEIEDLSSLLAGIDESPRRSGKLGGLVGANRNPPEEIPADWIRHSGCPACRIQRETRTHYLKAFADALGDSEMERSFRSSAGVCLPHLQLFLGSCRRKAARGIVLEVERQRLASLAEELRELCRKFDYRFTDEKVGEERDSWRRAVLLINGSPLSFPDSSPA